MVAILWAIFFSFLQECLSCFFCVEERKNIITLSVAALALSVILKHVIKTDNFDQEIRKSGYLGLLEKISQGHWGKLYGYYPGEALEGRREIARIAEELLRRDKGIDKFAISTAVMFYEVDPKKIPKDVTVGFLTNSYIEFYKLLDGQTFIQHPGGSMYTYLNYGEPDFRPTEKRALVISPTQ